MAPAARELQQRGQQVDVGHRAGDAPALRPVRMAHDERDPRRPLEEAVLVPHAALAHHVAVVGGVDHDGVVGQTGPIEQRQQAADLVVDRADHPVVAVAGVADVLVGDRALVAPVRVVQAAAQRIQRLVRYLRAAGQIDVVVTVAVPVLLSGGVGRVRLGEGHAQEERAIVGIAREVEQLLGGEELHLVVVVDLEAAQARPRLHHRAQVGARGDPLRPLLPVRQEGERRRVHIGGEPLLEAVELVRADEVHLAAQDGAVAEQREVVREGRGVGAELGGVVVRADGRGEPSRQHREPRRRTQRVVAVSGVEDHTAVGERLEMGRLAHRVPMDGQYRRTHLVGHQEQDVGGLAAHPDILCLVDPTVEPCLRNCNANERLEAASDTTGRGVASAR